MNTVTVISEMLKDKKKKTELCKLTFESMAVCLCKAAYLGLDYFNGECYAIPYGGELNFQTDYKGENQNVQEIFQEIRLRTFLQKWSDRMISLQKRWTQAFRM